MQQSQSGTQKASWFSKKWQWKETIEFLTNLIVTLCSHSEEGAMGRHRHIEEEEEETEDANVSYISIEMLGMVINAVHDKLFGIAWL